VGAVGAEGGGCGGGGGVAGAVLQGAGEGGGRPGAGRWAWRTVVPVAGARARGKKSATSAALGSRRWKARRTTSRMRSF